MKRTGVFAAAALAVAFAVGRPCAQAGEADKDVRIEMPSFNARMSMGFNYDLLRPMTGVSFQYPVGYMGFNVPLGFSTGLGDFLGDDTMKDIFEDGKVFEKGDMFKPTAGADQNANYSVRVDVPVLSGVGTFAYTQNFYMNFNTALGGSSVIKSMQDITYERSDGTVEPIGFLAVRGALRLPLSFSMGWETMTFGYAYRVGKGDDLVFALNMHRHLFSADIRMKADIDLLGHTKIFVKNVNLEDSDAQVSIDVDDDIIDFSSERCNGFAQGSFRADGWTPSVGVKWKRFALNSRFGLNVRAKGSARGGFVLPRVVDLATGDLLLGEKFQSFADSMAKNPLYVISALDTTGGNGIIPNNLDSIYYEVGGSFIWRMPQGHTLSYEIIPKKLTLSYTKLFGEVAVEMDSIVRKRYGNASSDKENSWLNAKHDIMKLDIGISVDHILVLSATYPSFFVNAGVGGFDIRSNDKYVLGGNESLSFLRVGNVVMLMPILNGGVDLGTKIRLRIEADILPLPVLRSGISYYF
jgi:hypothetical protein